MPYDFSDDSRSHTFINAHIVTQINIKEWSTSICKWVMNKNMVREYKEKATDDVVGEY